MTIFPKVKVHRWSFTAARLFNRTARDNHPSHPPLLESSGGFILHKIIKNMSYALHVNAGERNE